MSLTLPYDSSHATEAVKQALESMATIDEYAHAGSTITAVQNAGQVGNAAKLTIELHAAGDSTTIAYEAKKGNPLDITTDTQAIETAFRDALERLTDPEQIPAQEHTKEVADTGTTTIQDALGEAKDRLTSAGSSASETAENNSFREQVAEEVSKQTDQQPSSGTDHSRSHEPAQGAETPPEELIAQAAGDIKRKHLTDTSGRVIPWLEKPVLEHLEPAEQPEFIFADTNSKLEFEHPDGTTGSIGYTTGAQFLVITDQRILYLNGAGGLGSGASELEDEVLRRDYETLEAVGGEGGWLSDGIGFRDDEGIKYRFSVSGNSDIDRAIEYVEEQLTQDTPAKVNEQLQTLVENAEGETVTYDTLLETPVVAALDDGEQPHHLLTGNALLIDGGDEVEKKGGLNGSVTTAITDRRVLCLTEGEGIVTIPYDSITSIEWGKPPEQDWELDIPGIGQFGGQTDKLIIHTHGRVYYLDPDDRLLLPASAVADPDDHAQFVNTVINFIRERRAAARKQTRQADSSATESDPLDQIERLKELHDQGALTDDEFQEKKADLLDQI